MPLQLIESFGSYGQVIDMQNRYPYYNFANGLQLVSQGFEAPYLSFNDPTYISGFTVPISVGTDTYGGGFKYRSKQQVNGNQQLIRAVYSASWTTTAVDHSLHVYPQGVLKMHYRTNSTFNGTGNHTSDNWVIDSYQWNHIEWQYKRVNGSTGYFKVWVDGEIVIEMTAVDTYYSGTLTGLIIGCDPSGNEQDSQHTFDIKDLYVWTTDLNGNATPKPLSSWDCELHTPSADGTVQQWTANDGGNHTDNVDDGADHDQDTTRVESATTSNRDLFTFTGYAQEKGSLIGVAVGVYASDDTLSSPTLNLISYDGANTDTSTVTVTDGWYTNYYGAPLEKAPDATDWTIADFATVEFGIEVG